jgi:hypothetical protein
MGGGGGDIAGRIERQRVDTIQVDFRETATFKRIESMSMGYTVSAVSCVSQPFFLSKYMLILSSVTNFYRRTRKAP